MHQRTVPVTADVFVEALNLTPGDICHFLALHTPAVKAFKVRQKMLCIFSRDHVDESVAETHLRTEVDGQIHEIETRKKSPLC